MKMMGLYGFYEFLVVEINSLMFGDSTADGNLVAVWSNNIWKDVGDGTWSNTSSFHRDHDVFYRVFNPDGTFITDEVRVTNTLEDDRVQSVIANSDGSFKINYEASYQPDTPGNYTRDNSLFSNFDNQCNIEITFIILITIQLLLKKLLQN